MTESEFIELHRLICRNKGGKASCGRKLYRYLKDNNLPFDPAYRHKGHAGYIEGVTLVKTGIRLEGGTEYGLPTSDYKNE